MNEQVRGAGGTSGGIGIFFIGLAVAVAGGWLLTNQVTVTSGYWQWGGYNSFGLTLIPLIAGIAFLFFNGRSVIGLVLTFTRAAILLPGTLTTPEISFRPTSLFNTLMMLALLAGGIGLVARSLKAR